MIVRAWKWAIGDLRKGFAAIDPSKVMVALILFFGLLAVLDRAVYEIGRVVLDNMTERPTRL